MTTAIHHGNPGSFKSFGTIQRAIIPALEQGRTVVTNIRGLNSIERIEQALGKKMHADAQLIYVDADSAEGFRAMSVFFHWVPIGALIAIDEFQRVYSKKRDRDLKKYDLHLNHPDGTPRPDDQVKELCPLWDGNRDRPETVENAFDQHRHYNWDIYCTTPNIAKVHGEAREVAEVAYRHKALGAIMPWKKNCWREFTHDPEDSGKQLSHYMGSPKDYKADERVFACYQSTKTGKALGSSESRPLYRDPKLQAVSVGLLLCLLWFVYESVQTLERGSIVGIDSAETLAADHPDPVPVPVSPGRDDPGVVPAEDPAQARFDALAAAFDAYTRPTGDGIDPVAELLDRGAEPALDALIYVRASEKLLYRISFYAGERQVDQFDHNQLAELGYTAEYRSYGLLIEKDNQQTLIRQRYGRGGAVRNDAMLGAGSAAATVPPAPQTAL